MNKFGFVASEIDCRALMELSFVDICIWCVHHFKPFPELNGTVGPDWSKKCSKPMNISFAFEPLPRLALFIYGRFEFDAVSGTKPTKKRKTARNHQNCSRKNGSVSTSAKAEHRSTALGKNVLQSTIQNIFSRCKAK